MTSYLDDILENINLAVVSHVHAPIGAFSIQAHDRSLPVIIPGSMAVTTSGSNDLHTDVNLPVVRIADSGRVSCALCTFDLRANLLRFYKKKDKLLKVTMSEQAVMKIPKTASLVECLHTKGLNENQFKLVSAASKSYLEIIQDLRILGLIGNTQNGTA